VTVAVSEADAVNVGVSMAVGNAVTVGDDVIVDSCDVATVGDGNITLVSTSADGGVFRAVFVPSPSYTHQPRS
jgi:hypothetical protein